MNKSRGGLSRREFALKGTSNTKVSAPKEARKSASSSVSKDYKRLAKAQKEYLGALKPSKEEDIALKAQNALITQSTNQAKDIQDPTKNTVAAPFVNNQLDRLNVDTEAKNIPLKDQIAALQSNREAKAKFATAKYNTIAKNLTSRTTKTTNPLDEEYKKIRNEKAQVTLNKALSKGTGRGGTGTSKAYSNALAQSQKSILKGTSDRETEQQYLKTKFGKDLNVQDILQDGYQVKRKNPKKSNPYG